MQEKVGTLELGEIHPIAHDAMRYIKSYIKTQIADCFILLESMASCALSGNRTAEVCGETLRRIMHGENVSDRYLLGLAWYLKTHLDIKKSKFKKEDKQE